MGWVQIQNGRRILSFTLAVSLPMKRFTRMLSWTIPVSHL